MEVRAVADFDRKFFFFEILKRKDRIARESFNVLIPCRIPKSNDNRINKREIERGRE